MSLISIGIISYAFRPRNEGMHILQNLGRYTLMQQVLARLLLVLLLEAATAIPTAFLIYGHSPEYSLYMFLFGWMAPMLFMTVLGFVLTQWLGSWMAFLGCISVWVLQLLSKDRLDWAYLFISPANNHYWAAQNTMLLISSGMLLSYYFLQKMILQKATKGGMVL